MRSRSLAQPASEWIVGEHQSNDCFQLLDALAVGRRLCEVSLRQRIIAKIEGCFSGAGERIRIAPIDVKRSRELIEGTTSFTRLEEHLSNLIVILHGLGGVRAQEEQLRQRATPVPVSQQKLHQLHLHESATRSLFRIPQGG